MLDHKEYEQMRKFILYKAKQAKEKNGRISWKRIKTLIDNAFPGNEMTTETIRAMYRREYDQKYKETKNKYALQSHRKRAGKDTLRKILMWKLVDKTSLLSLYDTIPMDRDAILAEIVKMEFEGYEINKWDEDGKKYFKFRKRRYDNHRKIKIKHNETKKVLVISDTHFGHIRSEKEFTKKVIEYAYEKGVREVLHIGDLTEGHYMSIRPQAVQELEKVGFEDQVQIADDNLPKLKGLVYYIISGNHDHTYERHAYANPVRSLSKRREDIRYMGYNFGKVTIGKVDIAMVHPTDGIGQNYGLKLHKYIDRAGEDKQARIILMGHYHKHTHLHYKGVDGFIVPGLVSQSRFMKDNNLASVVGAFILNLNTNKKGELVTLIPEYIWREDL